MQSCKRHEPIRLFDFDAAYLEGLRKGDPDTVEHFYSYFYSVIGWAIRRRTQCHSLVDDVRQETFLRVLRAVKTGGRIEDPKRFQPYVVSVAQFVLYEHVRKEHWSTSTEDVTRPDTRPTPEVAARSEEMQRHIRRTLQSMSQRDQLILTMAADEISHDQIAQKLNVKITCVRVLLHRARSRFRNRLRASAYC